MPLELLLLLLLLLCVVMCTPPTYPYPQSSHTHTTICLNLDFHLHVRSLLFATSFFLSISEKCSYTRDCSCTCRYVCVYTNYASTGLMSGDTQRHKSAACTSTCHNSFTTIAIVSRCTSCAGLSMFLLSHL